MSDPSKQPAWAGGAGDTSVASYDRGAARQRPNTALGVVNASSHVPDPSAAPFSVPSHSNNTAGHPQEGHDDHSNQQQQQPNIAPNDVRLQPGYAEWYYSQNPRDPRAPPPLTGLGRYGFQTQSRGYTPPPGERDGSGVEGERQVQPDQTPPHQSSSRQGRRGKPVPMNPSAMAPVYGPSVAAIPSPGKPLFANDLLTPAVYGQSPPRSTTQGASGAGGGGDGKPMSSLQSYQAAAAAAMAASSPYAAAQMQLYPQMAALYGFVPPSPQQQWSAEEPAPGFGAPTPTAEEQPQHGSGRRSRGGRGGNHNGRGGGGGMDTSDFAAQSYAQQQEAAMQQHRAFEEAAAAAAAAGGGGYGGMMDGGDHGGHHAGGGRGEGRRGGRGGGRGGRGGGGRGGGGGGNQGGGGNNSASRQPRSPFLVSFHASHVGSSWNLSNVLGHVLELAKDQEGSRFIQHNLDAKRANPADVVDAVFDEVLEDPMSLMTDVFGNYVVQKMLDAATPAQLVRIAKRFAGHVLELTLHTFGCRVVQKAIQVFPREGLDTILSELRGHVAHCVQDQNGNHVIQKAIEQMPGDTDFVIQSFLGRVPEFATHAYGCRVIQCIFTHSPNRQDAVLAEIVQHTESLAQDQFGNYVVQHVLQSPDDAAAVAKMVLTLMPKYAQLSMHKFASNVMEKVYQRATPEQRMQVLKGLTTTDNAKGLAPLVTLMKDQFGNYVVQRMIDHSTGPEKEVMVEAIKPHIPDLRRVTFGKHIISRLERVSSLPAGTANGKA